MRVMNVKNLELVYLRNLFIRIPIRRHKNKITVLLLVLCMFFFFSLHLSKHRHNVEIASVYYFQEFLLNYSIPRRPLICESKVDKNFKKLNFTQSLSVKYNGTLIQTIYTPGFDILPDVCPNKGCGVDLLVVIHTSCENVNLRTAIRMTWKMIDSLPNVAMVFLMGRTEDPRLSKQATRESEFFGDIIVSRNLDTYDNLTLKSIAMAEWVAHNCPRARFVVKTDDDVFLNVVRLLRFINDPRVAFASRTFYGRLTHNAKPVRKPSHKFYISVDEYAGEVYSDYLQGSSYMFTGDLSLDLYSEGVKQDFFRMEDIFFTGFLADQLQAMRLDVKRFHSQYGDIKSIWQSTEAAACDLRTRFTVHYVRYEDIFNMWHALFGRFYTCNASENFNFEIH